MALLHVLQLFKGSVTNTTPSTGVTYATVPAGYRWVLRDISSRNLNGSGATTAYFFISGVIFYSKVLATGGTAGDSDDHQPWIVLGPGDTIGMRASVVAGFSVVISGSQYTI